VSKEQSLNIAILPDENTQREAIEMSEKIAQSVSSEFVLDGKNFYPHISVYQAHYPLKNLEKLKKAVALLATSTPASIHLQSFDIAYGVWTFWNCVDDGRLIKLHNTAVKAANPLREGLIMPQLADRPGLSADDKSDIQSYGSLLIGPRYRPHITLTRLSSESDESRVRELLGQEKAVRFKPRSLILGYLGDHGTVIGIIEEFPLGS